VSPSHLIDAAYFQKGCGEDMNRILSFALGPLISRLIRSKMRNSSIRAVRSYIVAVRTARLFVLGIFGLGVAASVLVSGLVLVLMGVLSLDPVPVNLPVALISTGVCLVVIATIVISIIFSQERWLKFSKSYELIETVLSQKYHAKKNRAESLSHIMPVDRASQI
jgi:hypothetical protein